MTEESRRHVLIVDTAAVVRNTEVAYAAPLYLNGNACGAAVYGIFHQFLDNRTGTFYDLTRSDKLRRFLA